MQTRERVFGTGGCAVGGFSLKTSDSEFAALLSAPESSRVEFKTAERNYDFEKLVKYVVAIANEGGGQIVLGASDKRPRRVLGTEAFAEPGKTQAGIIERVGRRVEIEELSHNGSRVLIVHIPARDRGAPWCDRGTYWKRNGESLLPMRDEDLRVIHSEIEEDFSAQVVSDADLADLDLAAIQEFAKRWSRRESKPQIESWLPADLLRNAELANDSGITRAALVLFGTRAAMGRLLPQAELVFEYRSSERAGPAQDRVEFREGFMQYSDLL